MWTKKYLILYVDHLPSSEKSQQPSKPSKHLLPVFPHTRLSFHYGSTEIPKYFLVYSSSDMLFFSQVKVNPSPTGPISQVNSREDNPNSETTSPNNQEQNFRQRKADIIYMSHMHALGVRTVSVTSCSIRIY